MEVPSKRSTEKVPIQFDWRDLLAIDWERGVELPAGARIRPRPFQATGLEYEVTTAGLTGNRRPIFPGPAEDSEGEIIDNGIGRKCRSGSVVFTARAVTDASLRAVASSSFQAEDGITLSDESDEGGIYTVYASGGTSGQSYRITQTLVLAGGIGETQVRVALLPVED